MFLFLSLIIMGISNKIYIFCSFIFFVSLNCGESFNAEEHKNRADAEYAYLKGLNDDAQAKLDSKKQEQDQLKEKKETWISLEKNIQKWLEYSKMFVTGKNDVQSGEIKNILDDILYKGVFIDEINLADSSLTFSDKSKGLNEINIKQYSFILDKLSTIKVGNTACQILVDSLGEKCVKLFRLKYTIPIKNSSIDFDDGVAQESTCSDNKSIFYNITKEKGGDYKTTRSDAMQIFEQGIWKDVSILIN